MHLYLEWNVLSWILVPKKLGLNSTKQNKKTILKFHQINFQPQKKTPLLLNPRCKGNTFAEMRHILSRPLSLSPEYINAQEVVLSAQKEKKPTPEGMLGGGIPFRHDFFEWSPWSRWKRPFVFDTGSLYWWRPLKRRPSASAAAGPKHGRPREVFEERRTRGYL